MSVTIMLTDGIPVGKSVLHACRNYLFFSVFAKLDFSLSSAVYYGGAF